MGDKFYYIRGNWLSWEQAHALGYTKEKPEQVIAYTATLNKQVITHDLSDDTYFIDHHWLNDFTNTGYYIKSELSDILYLSDNSVIKYRYSDTVNEVDPYSINAKYEYDGKLVTYEELHNTLGFSNTISSPFLVINGEVLAWYNEAIDSYWDNRSNKKLWTRIPPVSTSEVSSGSDMSNITELNAVGSLGLFLYNEPSEYKAYGAEIDGKFLKPVGLQFTDSGCLSYNKEDIVLTGTWKLMSVAQARTSKSPCIVSAMKISDKGMVSNVRITNIINL